MKISEIRNLNENDFVKGCVYIIDYSLTKKENTSFEKLEFTPIEKEYNDEVLDEALVFANTHKQAARIKCATLGSTGLKELIECEGHTHG